MRVVLVGFVLGAVLGPVLTDDDLRLAGVIGGVAGAALASVVVMLAACQGRSAKWPHKVALRGPADSKAQPRHL